MTRKPKRALALAIMLGTAALLTIFYVPHVVYAAWSTPCVPINATMQTGDIAVASDGTAYAAVIDGNGVLTVFKFPSADLCTNTGTVVPFSGAFPAPEQPLGAVESLQPQIAINSNNDVALTYRIGFNVYYRRKPAASSSFNPAVQVTNDGYVGDVAIDSAGNVHVVWYSPGVYYNKYNASDTAVITTTLSGAGDGPAIDVDSANNAHVVWNDANSPSVIHYQGILASGALTGSIQTVSANTDTALYPFIAVDNGGNIHVAWQGADLPTPNTYQAFYRKCAIGAGWVLSCDAQKNLTNNNSVNTASVHIAICGSNPYVSWYNNSSGTNQTYVSANLGVGTAVSGAYGDFNEIASGAGYIHAIFRNTQNNPGYARQADSSCNSGTPTPTVTGTPPTATPTNLPKVLVDDPDARITYAGSWSVQLGNPSCEQGPGWHYISASSTSNSASLSFFGTKVSYYYMKYSTLAQVDVLIDNVPVTTVNPNLPVGSQLVCDKWDSSALSPMTHTIMIRPNALATCDQTPCNIPLDAFEYQPVSIQTPTSTSTATQTATSTATATSTTTSTPTFTPTTTATPTITPTPTNTATRLPTVNSARLPLIGFDASP